MSTTDASELDTLLDFLKRSRGFDFSEVTGAVVLSSATVTVPLAANSFSARLTVGRRAPTSRPSSSWVSASGTITPAVPTRPQRAPVQAR